MKRPIYVFLAIVVVLFAAAIPADAYWRAGIWIGPGPGPWGPWRGPLWWGPPVYITPPVPPVVIEQQPTVYEQQYNQPEEQYYWYYCADSKAYYPYVKECPKGWMKVVPTPTPAPAPQGGK